LNKDQFFQHKLSNIFDKEISQSYEDETGYYVEVNDQWYQLSINKTNPQISSKIHEMIGELKNSSEE